MDLASLAPLVDLGGTGVALAVVIWLFRSISRGDWVPRRELDYMRADRDARLAEKDAEIAEWRGLGATERSAREVAVDHARDLASGLDTVNRALEALRASAERAPREK